MAHPEIDLNYVAHLARLALTPEEQTRFGAQLGQVLEHMEKLKQLDVNGIEPTAHTLPLANITRPDEVHPSLCQATALNNAPATANGLFLVPKIVE